MTLYFLECVFDFILCARPFPRETDGPFLSPNRYEMHKRISRFMGIFDVGRQWEKCFFKHEENSKNRKNKAK